MFTTAMLMELSKVAGAGMVAGLFAAFVAQRDHRFKKWWELRVAAYRDVIEALSDLDYVYQMRWKAETEGVVHSDKQQNRLTEMQREG
jgi:hypothetical protein